LYHALIGLYAQEKSMKIAGVLLGTLLLAGSVVASAATDKSVKFPSCEGMNAGDRCERQTRLFAKPHRTLG
jgi:hypothetical protein